MTPGCFQGPIRFGKLPTTANHPIVSGMTEIEKTLMATLSELDNAIKAMAANREKPQLLPLFTRLDDLTRRLPRDADPNLLHYLHKKSYEKARLLLQGRDAENARGNCHPHQP